MFAFTQWGPPTMIGASLFVFVGVGLCVLSVMAILGIADVGMSGAEAIERDGLARGTTAPTWTLSDDAGREYHSPPRGASQLVLFTDHSLKSFPSVVAGIRDLSAEAPHVEVVVLLRRASDVAVPVLQMLGLGDIPVLTGSPSLYGRYNVRVTPFAIFVDSEGRCRASSLGNHDWQIRKLWQLAELSIAPDDAPARRRSVRRAIAGAGS